MQHQWLVYLAGGFFILYGAAFALWPVPMSVFFTDAAPVNASGVIDMRANYGGLSLALGGLLCYLGRRVECRSLGLSLTGSVLLLMAIPRALGLLNDGEANVMMYLLLLSEFGFAGLAFYLRFFARK